jgi:glycosyltransferase involved in cell wall biosynthesis
MEATISIALCTYNAGQYLTQLLDSLLAQTLMPNEIIVCDDGSSDATKDILIGYQNKYPNLFFLNFNTTNLGYIKNFEQCINLCKSSYIAIADHDDIWLPHKLQSLFTAIQDGMLVYSDSQFISASGETINRKLTTQYHFFSKPSAVSFIFSNCVWGHTCMIKKELISYAFPIPNNAPYDIWLGFIAANVGIIYYVDEALTLWRQHESSFSNKSLQSSKTKQEQALCDFNERVNWMKNLQTSPYNNHKKFIDTLINLYQKKASKYSLVLLFFIIKHRKTLFAFWRKSEASLLNECRKLCRKVG